jgi:cytochrome bd-type quinol oxidase subunit 1
LLLVSVSGKVIEKVKVESFSAPIFANQGPIPFILRFLNEGTIHEKPIGMITVTDIFGKQIAKLEIPQKNVLPGAVRKVDTQWQTSWLLGGRYQATLVGNYGTQNNPISATVVFWSFPWLGFAILIVLILIIVFVARNRKKNKKIEAKE